MVQMQRHRRGEAAQEEALIDNVAAGSDRLSRRSAAGWRAEARCKPHRFVKPIVARSDQHA